MTADVPELWLARHGETEWSLARRHTGLTDLPLTAAGEEQARALAPRLAGETFALVLSSPLRRAADTARLAGFEPELDGGLVEIDYGDYEGITSAEIRERRPGWDLWTDGNPGGESVQDAAARLDDVAARLRQVEGRALVFGHGHALRVLAARWLGLDPREGRLLKLGTAALSILGSEHGRPAIERWNA